MQSIASIVVGIPKHMVSGQSHGRSLSAVRRPLSILFFAAFEIAFLYVEYGELSRPFAFSRQASAARPGFFI